MVWNRKILKSGKSFCTILQRRVFLSAGLIGSRSKKKAVREYFMRLLPQIKEELHERKNKMGEMDQKWLMVDLEDQGENVCGCPAY